MTTPRYALLFRIECRHAYFADGIGHPLSLRPTPACRRMLERYRLLFRPTPGGGEVHYCLGATPAVLAHFNEPAPFTFALVNSDPALIYYTDIDLAIASDPADTLYCFDNLADFPAAAVDAAAQTGQRLHPAGRAFDQGTLPVKAKYFDYIDCNNRISPSTVLSVIDRLTRHIVWQGQPSARPLPSLPIDLSSLPEGRYLLQVNGRNAWDFYLSDTPAVQQWGVVEIYAGGPRQSAYLPPACAVLDERGQPTPKTFTLALGNRKTTWRYYVISPTSRQWNDERCEIIATSKLARLPDKTEPREIRFERLPGIRQINGRSAWVFESEHAIALWQTPADQLAVVLRVNNSGTRSGHTVKLPYPPPDALAMDGGAAQQRVCSEAYVYL